MSWEMRPPMGGWNLAVTIKEQVFQFYGNPQKIVEEIAEILRANEIYQGHGPIWAECNRVWCARDPQRCTLPKILAEPVLAENP